MKHYLQILSLLLSFFSYFLQLVADQRSYYKAVQEFHEECTKNESLNIKLNEMRGAI